MNCNLYSDMFIWLQYSPNTSITDDVLAWENDTATHDKQLAYRKSSFRDGGVTFCLVAYLSRPSVPHVGI